VSASGDATKRLFSEAHDTAAGCAFGINHFPDPAAAVAEMARVAPLVGLLTWARPEVREGVPGSSWAWATLADPARRPGRSSTCP
jgi:ubiquinone/menaquinone biosynthesis C-methylase UbiE